MSVSIDDLHGEIADAIRRYEDRKAAVYTSRDREVPIKDDGMRELLIGLDLDLDELRIARAIAAQAGVTVTRQAHEALGDRDLAYVHGLAGTWVDGIITGLMIAEQRAQGESK